MNKHTEWLKWAISEESQYRDAHIPPEPIPLFEKYGHYYYFRRKFRQRIYRLDFKISCPLPIRIGIFRRYQ